MQSLQEFFYFDNKTFYLSNYCTGDGHIISALAFLLIVQKHAGKLEVRKMLELEF